MNEIVILGENQILNITVLITKVSMYYWKSRSSIQFPDAWLIEIWYIIGEKVQWNQLCTNLWDENGSICATILCIIFLNSKKCNCWLHKRKQSLQAWNSWPGTDISPSGFNCPRLGWRDTLKIEWDRSMLNYKATLQCEDLYYKLNWETFPVGKGSHTSKMCVCVWQYIVCLKWEGAPKTLIREL
jgi:hypothetical protein